MNSLVKNAMNVHLQSRNHPSVTKAAMISDGLCGTAEAMPLQNQSVSEFFAKLFSRAVQDRICREL